MDRLKDLKLKFKDFTEEAKVWFNSKDYDQFIQKIGTTFNIDSNSLWDLIIMLIENDFYIGNLEKDVMAKFQVDENKAKNIVVDMLGMVFYPINPYI